MTAGEQPADPYLGRVIAEKFRVDSQIGIGGVGTVYHATHLKLGRPVALKILRASLAADPSAVARFTREARLASQLDHPNIVHVYDYGTEPDGLTYLAMELLDGPELAQVMAREVPMPSERIVSLLSQVLSALGAAHRSGIVHRDLKPENILLVPRVGDDGETHEVVKVADFGIARTYGFGASPGDAITRFGAVSGTPEYMSPEQCMGDELDGRSDLYGVGVILYEMLVGRVPFAGELPVEVLEQHVRAPVKPPTAARPDADPRLEPVALRALAKKREDRYADAAEMRAALRAALELPRPAMPAAPLAPAVAPGGTGPSSVVVEMEPAVAPAPSVQIETVPSSVVIAAPDPSVVIEQGPPAVVERVPTERVTSAEEGATALLRPPPDPSVVLEASPSMLIESSSSSSSEVPAIAPAPPSDNESGASRERAAQTAPVAPDARPARRAVPVSAPPPQVPMRSRRGLWIALVALVVLGAGGAGAFWWLRYGRFAGSPPGGENPAPATQADAAASAVDASAADVARPPRLHPLRPRRPLPPRSGGTTHPR